MTAIPQLQVYWWAGCAVVGFHGLGGLEYAIAENGCGHFNDEIEAVVDNLYRIITGLQNNSPAVVSMINAAQAKAVRFNAEAMWAALVDFIESAR